MNVRNSNLQRYLVFGAYSPSEVAEALSYTYTQAELTELVEELATRASPTAQLLAITEETPPHGWERDWSESLDYLTTH